MIDELRFAPANDTKIAYRAVGCGEPLVIISGLADSLIDWKEEIVQSLAKNFYVILPDNRGVGRTRIGNIRPKNMTIEQFSEDIYTILLHENISKAYILGHSMGGMIAQEFVLRHPSMVKKLILYATDYGPDSSNRSRFMNLCVVPLQILCIISPGHTKGFNGETCAIASWKGTTHRMGDIRCPTLLLKGDSDFLMHTKMTEEMHTMIPDSEMILVPHGHHRWHDQCPKEFVRIVTEFFLRG